MKRYLTIVLAGTLAIALASVSHAGQQAKSQDGTQACCATADGQMDTGCCCEDGSCCPADGEKDKCCKKDGKCKCCKKDEKSKDKQEAAGEDGQCCCQKVGA